MPSGFGPVRLHGILHRHAFEGRAKPWTSYYSGKKNNCGKNFTFEYSTPIHCLCSQDERIVNEREGGNRNSKDEEYDDFFDVDEDDYDYYHEEF